MMVEDYVKQYVNIEHREAFKQEVCKWDGEDWESTKGAFCILDVLKNIHKNIKEREK